MPTKGLENISIFSLLFDLWKLIRFKRKSQLICLLMLMITSSFSEVFTLVTVIPFLQVLINPDSILEIKGAGKDKINEPNEHQHSIVSEKNISSSLPKDEEE